MLCSDSRINHYQRHQKEKNINVLTKISALHQRTVKKKL